MLGRVSTIVAISIATPLYAGAAQIAANEVVSHCEYKNPGNDQISTLSITLIDQDGKEQKNVYARYWKNYHGKDSLLDKMVLYTESPRDAVGTAFMRWGYTSKSGQLADQWIYLPQLRKTRRVSVRDPGDSFLGSDLTYGDMEERLVDADHHKVLRVEELDGHSIYVIESLPKENAPAYGKKISWYEDVPNWDQCFRKKTEYYDIHGNLLKHQELSWQQVNGAWAWDTVVVENVQTNHKSIFNVTGVTVDSGLKDRQFEDHSLKRKPR